VHEACLPASSRALLDRLESLNAPALRGWTLAGGTGLALQLGHRVSEDFDFFRTGPMDAGELHGALRQAGPCETLQEAEHTLTVLCRRVKLSFFRVRDPFLHPSRRYRFFEVASLADIALMKLAAVSGRGARKDFLDLYAILRTGFALPDLLAALPRKYGAGRANVHHVLKSLVYFEDAEREPMPRLRQPVDWRECKAFFVREARAIADA